MTSQGLEKLKTGLHAICCEHDVVTAYLFGSQAGGFDDSLSDVDIAVLFLEPPNETDWWERQQQLAADIEPLIAPKELDLIFLEGVPILLQWQVISRGKVLYCADETIRLDFEERVIGEWLDFGEWLKRFHREMISGILEERNHA